MNTSRTLQYGLKYAQLGFAVTPIYGINPDSSCMCPEGLDCTNKGKHPKGGYKNSTRDPEKIKKQFIKNYNIGVALGHGLNLMDLEFDKKHGGLETYETLKDELGPLPGPSIRTGGGGLSFLARPPEGLKKNASPKGYPGCDIRIHGWRVAPPSVHETGNPYGWRRDKNLLKGVTPCELPKPWLELVLDTQNPSNSETSTNGPINQGHRNTTLTGRAGVLHALGSKPEQIRDELLFINETQCKPPLEEDAIERIVASVTSYPRQKSFTDLGNSMRFVEQHGEFVRYVTQWKSWLIWDGGRWVPDETLGIERLAKETVRGLYVEAARIADDEDRKKTAKYALKCESKYRLQAMTAVARSEVAASAEEFDRDPDLLNFKNGTVDLPTAAIKKHNQADKITKTVQFNFDLDAPCTKYLKFLHQIMGGEKDPIRAKRLVKYLQTVFGYSLTGRTSEKAAFILYGSGDNGKTTLLSLFADHLIPEYSTLIQISSLMRSRYESTNTLADLADLRGARLVMTSETEEGQRLSEAKLKRITQGLGSIKVARKYENPFQFPETHKLFVDCNHRPVITDDGNAIWNRLHLIPFSTTIPKHQQNKKLIEEILLPEAEGILAWAVQGAVRWYKEGLKKPPEVDAATKKWRMDSDHIEKFLFEKTVQGKNKTVTSKELYTEYGEWCQAKDKEPLAKNMFGTKIKARGFESKHLKKGNLWRDIGLKGEGGEEVL